MKRYANPKFIQMKNYCRHRFMIIVILITFTTKTLDFITAMSNLSNDTFLARRIENNQVIDSTRSDMMHRGQANVPTAGKLDSLRNIARIFRSSYQGLPK